MSPRTSQGTGTLTHVGVPVSRPRIVRRLAVVACLAVLVVPAGCGLPTESESTGSDAPAAGGADDATAPAGRGEVVKHTDGDTLTIRLASGDEKVRLIGIDTPETKKPGTPVECFGKEASAHLAELLPLGTAVRVERDVEARDRFDRLLAYVYRDSDGLFVNLAMVRDGYAGQLTIPPNVAHAEEFTAAAREARDAGRGLWGACGGNHEPMPG